jgi:excinuclease ABC subunit C
MSEKIRVLISNLKHSPGVYLMHDKDDNVIYVGKAKDLQKRVSQYFLRPQSGKVFKMVQNVDYFETIIVQNEKEALILEMNLIHKYYPRFNILLKDGSHYPYIAIKKKGDVTLTIKRNNKDKNYDYYGPFPNSGAAYKMVDLLNKVYPIRKCRNIPTSVCLYYHLGQCLAPCVNKIDEEVYDSLREKIKNFLNGNNQEEIRELKNKMLKASDELNFELAKEYKDLITSIEHINTSMSVESKDKTDRDIFAFSSRNGYSSIAFLIYRNGMLLGKESHVVEQFGNEEEQVVELITQLYERCPLPQEIIVNSEYVVNELQGYLDVSISSVSKGKLYDLIMSAKSNADNALDEYFLSSKLDTDKIALIEELGNLLHIKTPYHIELFDNSHLQGSSPVGAMVAYINGEAAKSLYRKFKIEHEESRDDFKSMEEVITRHYSRLKNENKKYPDLILVDGGLPQVNSATKALKDIEVDIPVFGLYKDDKHSTSGLIDIDGNTYPIENKKLFFLLTRMQDEVHRFAISFHKEKRNKAMTVSIFDEVKGLGNKRRELLSKFYPDISSLKEATVEELAQILPQEVAKSLYNKLHN